MPRKIGRYEIQAELGRGGFGQVFRAFDPTVGRLVAIKTLSAGGEEDILKRFRNEAAAAGRLHHNNIVIIYDFGDDHGTPYLVMELLDGEDLERIIVNRRPLGLLQKLDIIGQSASGLQHAHGKGILHRDIKPANIMLQHDSVVKIMDFGIALLTQATAARITPQGSLIGTLPYMAPEQFNGSISDAQTDIFAFGVTCYKLLTGTHPFHAEEMGGLMYNIMNREPEPLRALSPECPELLEQAVLKMLSKSRDSRYQSLEDVRFDLEPVIAELKKERVSDLVGEARSLLADRRLDEANSVVRQALEADPANRTARELRETLQRQIREEEIRPRIAALADEGRGYLRARDYKAAVEKVQSALQLHKSSPELQALLSEIKASWERAEAARKLCESAQQSLDRGDLTAAHRMVVEGLNRDPQHPQAETLRASIEQSIAARERARKLDDGLNHARRLMVLESFEQAMEGLSVLAQAYPESTTVRELLARARKEHSDQARRHRMQSVLDEARTLLKNGRFREAVAGLTHWREEFPESTELRELAAFAAEELRTQMQNEAVTAAHRDVLAMMEQRNFDPALERLRKELAQYPSAGAIRDLIQTVSAAKSEYERKTAQEEVIAQATPLILEQRFGEALERIGAFARAYGDSPQLQALSRTAEEGLEKQRRSHAARQVVMNVRSLLDQNKPEGATEVLQVATMQFPEDPELRNLYDEAKQRLDQQRVSEKISSIVSEAESLTRTRHFDRALEVLDQGLQDFPNTDRLIRCRQATIATKSRQERVANHRKALEAIRGLMKGGNFDEALAQADAAIAEFGDDPALAELKQQVTTELDTRSRASQVNSIVQQARELLQKREFDSASRILDVAESRFPGTDALVKLRELAEAQAQEQMRSAELQTITVQARRNLENGRFEEALQTIEGATRRLGEEQTLLRLREEIVQARRDAERLQALHALKNNLHRLQLAGRFGEALTALSEGLRKFGAEPDLLALQPALEAGLEAQRLDQGASALAAEAESLLSKKQAAEAVKLLEGAPQFHTDRRVAELFSKSRQALEEQMRERAITEVERNVERLVQAGEYAQALERVNRALKHEPNSSRLANLKESVMGRQATAQALAAGKQAHGAGEFERALSIVQTALTVTPENKELQELRSRTEAQLAQRQQAAAIRKCGDEAEALISRNQPDAALALLRPAAVKYPGERRLSDLLSLAEGESRRLEREKDLAAAKAQAESLIGQQKYGEAIALLNARFPGEARFRELLAGAQAQQDRQRQQEGRERARTQLLAIEQRVPVTKQPQLKRLLVEASQAIAGYEGDGELVKISSRIGRQVEELLAAPPPPLQPTSIPWKWIGAAAAVAIVAAGAVIVPRLLHNDVPKPATFRVEIRTEPAGAAVSAAGRNCTPPDCSFDLTPGTYLIEARLSGYQAARRSITVDPANPPGVTTLTLQPEVAKGTVPETTNPTPPEPVPQTPNAARAALVVRTGVVDARVFVDNAAAGSTDARGELRTAVTVGKHEVRVEKPGFKAVPGQRLDVTSAKNGQSLTFDLVALPARLQITGAPKGVEIRAAGGAAAYTDGSASFSMEVRAGEQALQIREGKVSRQVSRRFEPGGTVTLGWREIAPQQPAAGAPQPSVPQPAAPQPATLSAEAKETQEWDRVKNSQEPEPLENFLRDYRGGAHNGAASARLDELLWARVKQSDVKSIQAYEQRLPKGAHAADAQRLREDLAWNAVNKTNAQSLQAYIDQNKTSRHRQEAQTILDRMKGESEEKEKLVAAERTGILAAIQSFNDAFVHKSAKELKAIWPGALRDWSESMNQKSAYFVATLFPAGSPEISGDKAVLRCDLTTMTIVRGQPQPGNKKSVKVTLKKSGNRWLIEDPRGQE